MLYLFHYYISFVQYKTTLFSYLYNILNNCVHPFYFSINDLTYQKRIQSPLVATHDDNI